MSKKRCWKCGKPAEGPKPLELCEDCDPAKRMEKIAGGVLGDLFEPKKGGKS